MTDNTELVHLVVEDGVATITLDSPTNRNALSRRLVAELIAHLHSAEQTEGVRVVVLTHTGGTFCAGADLAEAVESGMEQGTRSLLALLTTIVELAIPVVAVVRGHARAGGVGLIGACDIALASDGSTYGFTEALLGLTPAIISLTTRSRLAERDAARKYLTGATFDGREAARSGLVTESAPADQLDATLDSRIMELCKASPQGLRETKALLNGPLSKHIAADGERLVELSARLFASDEAREGMTAFRERRPPAWAPRAQSQRA
ncbi:MAG: enoyl-CoA hydratase family protein [Nocardioidaceae bacterium]